MAKAVVVHSVTGERVDLSDASDEQLAKVLDEINDAKSQLRETENLVFREVAKRAGSKTRLTAGDFQMDLRTYVNVTRRSLA